MSVKKQLDNTYVFWLTGRPASGKSTLALMLQQQLKMQGRKVEMIDGDEIRKYFSFDLGFSLDDREKQVRRVIYLCQLLTRNDIDVIVAIVCPLLKFRQFARYELQNFVEIYLRCSLEECVKRDPKGLYKKALTGEIKEMTGIQQPFEEPDNPDITIDTGQDSVEICTTRILSELAMLRRNRK